MKHTDNFWLKWRLDFAVLQFLPVDIAVEQVILDFLFLTGRHTAAESGIRCLCQQLYTEASDAQSHSLTHYTECW